MQSVNLLYGSYIVFDLWHRGQYCQLFFGTTSANDFSVTRLSLQLGVVEHFSSTIMAT